MSEAYERFIATKAKHCEPAGFAPAYMPDWAMDFQSHLIDWSVRLGRAAVFAECGLGKTPMQLAWAENVVRKTNRPVMLATPLAVGAQTIAEAEKFGIAAKRTRDGVMTDEACVWVTNYEQLHKYDPSRFAGFVGDESSAIKDSKSIRCDVVGEFCRRMPYRSLWTATAAPNDYHELGTSSDVLGYLGYRDMLTKFFKQDNDKSIAGGWGRAKYRFIGHAEQPFWSWVCSWARSLRKPSDLGFDDSRFILPPLNEVEHVVKTAKPRAGALFTMAAKDMREERAERRHSIAERCGKVAELLESVVGPAVAWCELNDEGDELERIIPGCVQVSGSDSDDEKEEKLIAFSSGQIQRLVTKPKIGAWGLNWQHCADVAVLPSHSYEQYYQLVRRFYRFGQKRQVNVHLVLCEGEIGILKSLRRKQEQADRMFSSVVKHMGDALHILSADFFPTKEEVPSWLSLSK